MTQTAVRLLQSEVKPSKSSLYLPSGVRQHSSPVRARFGLAGAHQNNVTQTDVRASRCNEGILSVLWSPGTPYGTLSPVVSKLVAKSHLWIFSETNPELSKNKIVILNFAKPTSYLEPARALMWYWVCDSDLEKRMSKNYSCRILPLSSCTLREEKTVTHRGTCTRVVVRMPPLVSDGKFLCF